MRTKRALLASLLLLSLALRGPAVPVFAQTPGSYDTQIAAKRAQANKVQTAMEKMRADLATKIAQYSKITDRLNQTRARIDETTNRIAQIDAALSYQQAQLDALIIRSYKSGGLDFLSVMLGTNSFEDFLTRVDFLGRLGQHDSETITQVKGARAESQQLKDTLTQQENQLVALRSQADAERAQIEAGIAKQQAMLNSLSADIATLVKQQEQARAAAAKGQRWDPNAGGKSWIAAGSLLPGAFGTLQDRAGEQYLIPKGVPVTYKSTGISWGGVASWYGNAENGTGTSSGRPYNENELTCANKELPLGTLLAISAGGKHCIVLITDRGPYVAGRDIDLSKAAATAVGLNGVGPVQAEIVVPAK